MVWIPFLFLIFIVSFAISFILAIKSETNKIEQQRQQHKQQSSVTSLSAVPHPFSHPQPLQLPSPSANLLPISQQKTTKHITTTSISNMSNSSPQTQTQTQTQPGAATNEQSSMDIEKQTPEQKQSPKTSDATAGVGAVTATEKVSTEGEQQQGEGGEMTGNGKKRRLSSGEEKEMHGQGQVHGHGHDKSPHTTVHVHSPQAVATTGGTGTGTGTGKETGAATQHGKEAKTITDASNSFQTDPNFFAQLILHEKAEVFAVGGEPQQTPIWICNRDDKVMDVFQGLIKRNILSVPVLLKKNSKYYGFLDLMDIVRYIVAHFGSSRFQQDKAFFELVEEEQHFKEKTVDDLMTYPLSNRNPFQPVIAGYSAFTVIELMAREPNLHRVPVINSQTSRQLLNLITQSQCIKYLREHLEQIGQKRKKTINQCVYTPSVLSVSEDTPAIDAFNMMVTKQVQGLAIVTEEGRLRGNLSLRDLKLIGSDAALFWRLHQTVKNFVLKLRAEWQQRHGRPRSVVYVIPTATLEEVILTLSEHNLHRIYVCDSHQNKKPIGVIALRDVLLEIISP